MAIAAAGLILVSVIASAAIPAILLLWFDLFVWFRLSALLAPALLSQYSPGCVGRSGVQLLFADMNALLPWVSGKPKLGLCVFHDIITRWDIRERVTLHPFRERLAESVINQNKPNGGRLWLLPVRGLAMLGSDRQPIHTVFCWVSWFPC